MSEFNLFTWYWFEYKIDVGIWRSNTIEILINVIAAFLFAEYILFLFTIEKFDKFVLYFAKIEWELIEDTA